jgi:uncharacterized OsmC-like protein
MNDMDLGKIKHAFERAARLLRARPALARNTGITRVRVRDGCTCDVEEGPWKLTVDLPRSIGGNEQGPTPGTLGRAALGGCLAMGYIFRAAVLQVPIESLEVEVQGDYDERAMFELANPDQVPPDYQEVRYIVTVTSDAPEADILRVIEEGDARSAYLQVFARPQPLRRELRIRTTTETRA